ncbi:MAG: hypothetical protein ACRDKL_09915, partial [Solirubrobacteraceae bacterium]
GYTAMRLLLAAIRRATGDGRHQAQRVKVVLDLHMLRQQQGPLGTFRIEPNGDTSLDAYDVYRVVAGRLRYWRQITG